MHSRKRKLLVSTCLAAGILLCSGCHEGIFARYSSWSPSVRHRWNIEQQRYGFNLNRRLTELRKLRRSASGLTPQVRAQNARDLADVLKNTDERSPILRSEVVLTLASLQDSTADQAILDTLDDESPMVRRACCQAIAIRGGDAGVAELVRVLQSDDDADVRLTAAQELARFKQNDQAIRALGVMLDETDPALQFQAMRSLSAVTGKRLGNDVPAWREYLGGGNPPDKDATLVQRLFGAK